MVLAPPAVLLTPSLPDSEGGVWGGRELQCCVNAAQQCPKKLCVTSILVATNTKYSTLRADVGKVKPISARSNTSTCNKISILESY